MRGFESHLGQLTFSFKRRESEPSQVVVLCCLALYWIGLIDLIMYINVHVHTGTYTLYGAGNAYICMVQEMLMYGTGNAYVWYRKCLWSHICMYVCTHFIYGPVLCD